MKDLKVLTKDFTSLSALSINGINIPFFPLWFKWSSIKIKDIIKLWNESLERSEKNSKKIKKY